MRAAKELTGDPALALHYGETVDLSQVSIVGLISAASETMVHAFAQVNRYGRLAVEIDGPPNRFWVEHDAQGRWVIDRRENPNDFPELTETTFARTICGPRLYGVTQLVKAVQVTHPEPSYRAEYERIFGAPVTFGALRNALLIDETWLHHRLQRQPRYAFGILCSHADALLTELESARTVHGRVESLLLPLLHTGDASMTLIAGKLGLSRQTLFRQLKAEGTTFERVLDALRHRMALDYLRTRKVSVNQTAYLTGFSEPAAFRRAFKRWTGTSPKAMRDSTK
jgi:AraC-like DNA-binding protein